MVWPRPRLLQGSSGRRQLYILRRATATPDGAWRHLERQTKSHLDDPCRERRADRAKSSVRCCRVGRLEIRPIKKIEKLHTIFQFALLAAQIEVLVQAQIALI